MSNFTITPDTPFSLEAADSFGFGPHTGRPKPERAVMRMAFVTDDLRHQIAVRLGQDAGGDVHAQVIGDAGTAGAEVQVRRILSLDQPGTPWLAVGDRDPVVGALQATRFGLDGQEVAAFPLPARLLEVTSFPGLDPTRISRLHAVAEAALAGRLDPVRLRAMDAGDALRQIQEIPGLGPTYAQLVLLRSTGATDVMTYREPRIPYYAAHFYRGSQTPITSGELARLADAWRPFRTWVCVLLRVAGDRAQLPTPGGPVPAAPLPAGRGTR